MLSLHTGRNQAWDDRTLPRRIFYHLQARQARSPRYRCHPLLQIHPSEVDAIGKNCFVGAERNITSILDHELPLFSIFANPFVFDKMFFERIPAFWGNKKEKIIDVKLKRKCFISSDSHTVSWTARYYYAVTNSHSSQSPTNFFWVHYVYELGVRIRLKFGKRRVSNLGS